MFKRSKISNLYLFQVGILPGRQLFLYRNVRKFKLRNILRNPSSSDISSSPDTFDSKNLNSAVDLGTPTKLNTVIAKNVATKSDGVQSSIETEIVQTLTDTSVNIPNDSVSTIENMR